jgi:polar amino acid transport system substrate-binding protein
MAKWGLRKVTVLVLIVLFHAGGLRAEEPLLIVTDLWPPYVSEVDGNITGTDVEITLAVFQQLGIPVTIQVYPWQRCLLMVEHKEADAVLDVSITPGREKFLYFPEEQVSEGITVFFTRAKARIPFTTLKDLNGLRCGTILGYNYCTELDNAEFMQHALPVRSLEQNFKMLLMDRLDVVLEVDKVGYYVAGKMGITDQITVIPGASYCNAGNYLAFSRKSGYDQLASEFNQALQSFKTTDSYKKMLEFHGTAAEKVPEKTSLPVKN